MGFRHLFVAVLFSSTGLAATALFDDARAPDPPPPAHALDSPFDEYRNRDWGHVNTYRSATEKAGWYAAWVHVENDTDALVDYAMTGSSGPRRAYWNEGGGGSSHHSCPARATHLLDCPEETFRFEGRAGSSIRHEREGERQFLMRVYGGHMRFAVTAHTDAPLTLHDAAEGDSHLLVLTPPRDAQPGRYVLETTVDVSEPFVAEFRGRDAFHAETLDVIAADGTTQTMASCDSGGGPAPRGNPGRWSFRVTGTMSDDEPLAAALVGLLLGERISDVTIRDDGECVHAASTRAESSR